MTRTTGEVTGAALRLLDQLGAERIPKLEALRRDIAEGLASLDAGEGRPLDIEAIKRRGRQMGRS